MEGQESPVSVADQRRTAVRRRHRQAVAHIQLRRTIDSSLQVMLRIHDTNPAPREDLCLPPKNVLVAADHHGRHKSSRRTAGRCKFHRIFEMYV